MNLPHVPTAFVGRESEVGAAAQMLSRGRLLTLTGPGGVGKTRTSLEVASRARAGYLDGVLFLDLSAVDASGVDAVAVAAFSAWLSEALPGGEALEATLDAIAARQALVVIDNCEHVLGAAERLASQIVTRCPAMAVLATSREPLGAPGEVVWRLSPLTADDAVHLFCNRARLLVPDFEIESARDSVAAICERVDRLPLGIELAAAWVPTLPPKRIESELDGRLAPLRIGGTRGRGTGRHDTLTAALDWSYDLLDDTERAVLNRLWVFAGWFHLDATDAVCAEVTDSTGGLIALRNLVAKSLVIAEPRGDQPWYRLLETVREYSRRRFDDEVSARAAGETSPEPAEPALAVLARDGDEWLVGLPGRELRLPDLRGMRYLHALLSRPGEEMLASQLAGRPGGDRSDSGPVIDAKARSAYEQRIRDLQLEVDEARERNDIGRAGRLEDELDQLVKHLAAALGLGRKVRRTGSALEQDRSSVTKAIRATIARIDAHEPVLGKHLAIAIRTGTYCSYDPAGASAVRWTL